MKRKRDINPCFLCETSGYGATCDGGRPCSRCLTVLFTPHKCVGGSRLYSPNPQVNKSPEKPKATSNANGSTIKTPIPSTHIHNGNSTTATFSSKEKPIEEDANSQEYINKYLIQQLKTLQLAQDKLKEEVNELRTQNLQLTNDLQLLRTNQLIRSGTDDLQIAANFECPMVIYDLTQNPPKVLTANSMFCNMLGYNMSDVIGSIWTKFIHHDYLERTVQCFVQNMESSGAKNKPIILDQCYKDVHGNLLLTKDSYIILHNNGTPRSVFVNVKPMSYNGKQKNRPPIRIRNIQPKPPPSPTMGFTIPPNTNNGSMNLPNYPQMKQNGELISPSTSPTGRMFFPENFFSRINIPSNISDLNTSNINPNNPNAFSVDPSNSLNLSNSSLPTVSEYFSPNNDNFLDNLMSPGAFLSTPSPTLTGSTNTPDSSMNNGTYNHLDIPDDELWKEISSSEYWDNHNNNSIKSDDQSGEFDFQYDQPL